MLRPSEPGVVTVVAEEGSDVILPCSLSTKENIGFKLFDWKKDGPKEVFLYDAGIHYNNGRSGQDEQFKGRVSHFEDELKNGNASIIIRHTKMADSGNYSCIFPRLQPKQIFHISLLVGEYLNKTVNLNILFVKISSCHCRLGLTSNCSPPSIQSTDNK